MSDCLVKIEPLEIKTEEIEIKEELLDQTAFGTILDVQEENVEDVPLEGLGETDNNNITEKSLPEKQPQLTNKFAKKASRIRQCKVCPYQSQKTSNFLRHLAIHTAARQHSTVLPWFYCYHCNYKVSDKTALVKHVRLHKPSERFPFTCTECGRKFNEKGGLNSHIVKKHYDNKTLRDTVKCCVHHCPKCHYKDVNKSKVTRHWNNQHRTKSCR